MKPCTSFNAAALLIIVMLVAGGATELASVVPEMPQHFSAAPFGEAEP